MPDLFYGMTGCPSLPLSIPSTESVAFENWEDSGCNPDIQLLSKSWEIRQRGHVPLWSGTQTGNTAPRLTSLAWEWASGRMSLACLLSVS